MNLRIHPHLDRRPRCLRVGLLLAWTALTLAGWPTAGRAEESSGKHGLHGYVYSSSGDKLRSVGGATIEFSDPAGRLVVSATSGPGGYYSANLRAGTYFYKVAAPGYKDEHQKRGITLRPEAGYQIYNFTLGPGSTQPQPKPNPTPKTPEIAPPARTAEPANELPAKASVIVMVSEAETDRPVEMAVVRLRPPQAQVSQGVTDRAGRTTAAAGAAGEWQIVVTAPGFRSVTGRAQTTAGKQTTVRVRLTREADIVAGQTPPVGPAMDTVPAGPAPVDPQGRDTPRRDVPVTPEVPRTPRRSDIPEPRPVPATTLTMSVVDGRTGLPLANAAVRVSREGAPAAQGITNPQGMFRATLAPGQVTLEVRRPPYGDRQGNMVLVAGDNRQTIRLVEAVSRYTIQVVVREKGASTPIPVADATIRILDAGRRAVSTGRTDGRGRFTAKDLPAGMHTVVADKAGYASQGVAVDLRQAEQQAEVLLARPVAAESARRDGKEIPAAVVVPDVREKSYRYGSTVLQRAGLRAAGPAAGDDAIIVSQNPAPGTRVPPGTAVTLQIRRQEPKKEVPAGVVVPDVREKSYRYGSTVLQRAGLRTAGPAAGDDAIIVSQNPAPGTRVPAGTAVTLQVRRQEARPKQELPKVVQPPKVVEQPKPRPTAVVPNVVGRTYGEAAAALQAVGLRATGGAGDRSAVIGTQSVAAGQRVAPGSAVQLTIRPGRQIK